MELWIWLTAAAVTTLLVPAARWWLSRTRLRLLASAIPGPPTLPFIGNVSSLLGSDERVFRYLWDISKQFFPTFRLWLLSKLIVSVADPDDLQNLMNSRKCLGREFVRKAARLANLHNNIFSAKPEDWARHRKIMSPAFKTSILMGFVPSLCHKCNELVEIIQGTRHDDLDILELMSLYMSDTVFSTLLGVNTDVLSTRENNFYDTVNSLLEFATDAFRNPVVFFQLIFKSRKVLQSLAAKRNQAMKTIDFFIKERQKKISVGRGTNISVAHNATDPCDGPLLTKMLEHRSGKQSPALTEDELKMNVLSVSFAGIDTTSTEICFALALLSFHPQVQDKLFQEMVNIFDPDLHRIITCEDLERMKYLEQVIKETLRLYPAVPFVLRQASEETEIKGYTIPAGSIVAFNLFASHRNPTNFPNPDNFDPDNFSSENEKIHHPYAFTPFSGGTRKCLGYKYALLQMKVILSTIVRHFAIQPIGQKEDLDHLKLHLIIRPVKGFKVKFVPRKLLS